MKKFFYVKCTYDDAKRFSREFNIKDWRMSYSFNGDGAEFLINKDNKKDLEKALKTVFGKVEITKYRGN